MTRSIYLILCNSFLFLFFFFSVLLQASYGVEDPEYAVTQLAQTTMRSELGKLTLDKVFRVTPPPPYLYEKPNLRVQTFVYRRKFHLQQRHLGSHIKISILTNNEQNVYMIKNLKKVLGGGAVTPSTTLCIFQIFSTFLLDPYFLI